MPFVLSGLLSSPSPLVKEREAACFTFGSLASPSGRLRRERSALPFCFFKKREGQGKGLAYASPLGISTGSKTISRQLHRSRYFCSASPSPSAPPERGKRSRHLCFAYFVFPFCSPASLHCASERSRERAAFTL